MRKEFQEILDECQHPFARTWLKALFERHDDVMEALRRSAEDKICEQRARIGFDGDGECWTLEDGFMEWNDLSELGQELLNRYVDKASSQVRKQIFGSGNLKSQVTKRTNRMQGIKRANDRINKEPEKEPYEEGIGSALGSIAKDVAAHAVAHGLGVSGSSVRNFVHHLTKKSSASPKLAAQNPVKLQPAAVTHSSTTWQPVQLHHVFNGEPGEHEHSLDQAVIHHNIGTWAKSKGDHSKAEIHFRARDKHFKNYVSNAPRENLKKLNQDKVKSIFN